MPAQQGPFAIRSKVWIEDREGNVVFGLGRCRMLAAIHRTGSLNAAARELKMSYRAVWMRIRTSEQRLGKALVEKAGNGSRLTPFAQSLLTQFENLQERVNGDSDTRFEETLSGCFK